MNTANHISLPRGDLLTLTLLSNHLEEPVLARFFHVLVSSIANMSSFELRKGQRGNVNWTTVNRDMTNWVIADRHCRWGCVHVVRWNYCCLLTNCFLWPCSGKIPQNRIWPRIAVYRYYVSLWKCHDLSFSWSALWLVALVGIFMVPLDHI